jgi:hypothetical protein
MKTYLILFREPDGRQIPHTAEYAQQHQVKVKAWLNELIKNDHLISGNALSLNGKVIGLKADGKPITNGPYQVNDTEIIGGYLIIKANDLDQATELIKSSPIFDSDAFAEVREMM